MLNEIAIYQTASKVALMYGYRSMRRSKRSAWNEEDFIVASKVFHYTIEALRKGLVCKI